MGKDEKQGDLFLTDGTKFEEFGTLETGLDYSESNGSTVIAFTRFAEEVTILDPPNSRSSAKSVHRNCAKIYAASNTNSRTVYRPLY